MNHRQSVCLCQQHCAEGRLTPSSSSESGEIPSLGFHFPSAMAIYPVMCHLWVFAEGHDGVLKGAEGKGFPWLGWETDCQRNLCLSLVSSTQTEAQDRVC